MISQMSVVVSVGSGPVVCYVASVCSFVCSVASAVFVAAVFWWFCLYHLQCGYAGWRLPLGHFGFKGLSILFSFCILVLVTLSVLFISEFLYEVVACGVVFEFHLCRLVCGLDFWVCLGCIRGR